VDDAQAQLDRFIDKYSPETASLARRLLVRMRARLPGATIMVYDNYNALAIGFGAVEKPSRAVLSLAVFPRHVTLCFLWGKGLSDPHGLLGGSGSRVRHVRLAGPDMLDDPRVKALIAEAVARSEPPFDSSAEQRLVVRSVSARQRPRR
jgi:hypothetical protein